MPDPTFPTSIRLSERLRGLLTAQAKQRRWTLAATIIFALEDWVMAQKRRRK